MKYLKIVNWEKFQHYKNRNPPWIKLHNQLTSDYAFRCLQDDSKLLQILLWLVASRTNNRIPLDLADLQAQLGLKKKVTMKMVQSLIDKGFIECYQDDSGVLSHCAPLSRVEESRVEREKSREEKKRGGFSPPTSQEIVDYGRESGNDIDGQRFIDFYSSKGWMVGKNKMKDWKAAVRNWKRRKQDERTTVFSEESTAQTQADRGKRTPISSQDFGDSITTT